MTLFRMACLAALALFALGGLVRHHGDPEPDPVAELVAYFNASGLKPSQPKTVFWGVPEVSVTVPDCPDPVEAIAFVFDDIAIAGVREGVMADKRGTLQVAYAGRTFAAFDRDALFGMRLRNGVAQFLRTGRASDPQVIFLFWPRNCTPRPIS